MSSVLSLEESTGPVSTGWEAVVDAPDWLYHGDSNMSMNICDGRYYQFNSQEQIYYWYSTEKQDWIPADSLHTTPQSQTMQKKIEIADSDREAFTLLLHGFLRLSAHDDVERVSSLLNQGGDPNLQSAAPEDYGNSAVHWCAWHGKVSSLRVLLEVGGSPTLRNSNGETPLDLARLRLILENSLG